MANNNSRKLFHSRLARKEERRNLRNAFLFAVLTIVLLLALIFLGIPALIRGAIFFSDIKNANTPIEQNDTVPPPVPRFNVLPEYTKDSSLSLSGYAETGSAVEIFLNGSPVGTIVSTSEGTFVFDKINLGADKNEIYAIATDTAGNKSQPSQKITIIFDSIPPKLEISQPQDGETVNGERKRKITITGQTEESVTLTINDRVAILSQAGSFRTDYILNDGENSIKIVATDQAGNQTEKDIKVIFVP